MKTLTVNQKTTLAIITVLITVAVVTYFIVKNLNVWNLG